MLSTNTEHYQILFVHILLTYSLTTDLLEVAKEALLKIHTLEITFRKCKKNCKCSTSSHS